MDGGEGWREGGRRGREGMRTPKKHASALLKSQVVLIQTAHSWVNASISSTQQQLPVSK